MTALCLPPWPDAGDDLLAPLAEHDDLRAAVRGIVQRCPSLPDVRAATGSAATGPVATTPSATGLAGSGPGFAIEAAPATRAIWHALNDDLGIGTIAVPEDQGGTGYGLRELGVVLEELGAGLVAAPALVSSVLAAQALLRAPAGTIDDLLAGVVTGDRIATVAPPGGGPPTLDAATGARGWSVSGPLPALPHGAVADLVVAPVATAQGPALVVVEVAPATLRRPRTVLDASRPRADLALDAAHARLLVAPDRFAVEWERLRCLAAVAVAAEHAGVVDRLLTLVTGYVTERTQFGRPIGSFQAIKHRLADLLVDRERTRSAARYAAAAFDRDWRAARLPAAVAGAVCTDAVLRVAHEAVQLHGGIGFTWEHDAHLYLRRALGDEGLWGSARAHRSRVAELIGVD